MLADVASDQRTPSSLARVACWRCKEMQRASASDKVRATVEPSARLHWCRRRVSRRRSLPFFEESGISSKAMNAAEPPPDYSVRKAEFGNESTSPWMRSKRSTDHVRTVIVARN
jgi:hypothetical protein